ncbi:hypothetical protein [Pseudomonas sp. PDM27]|uniref:hypothetical protein n=1 Tax=Pseudomonas sp. PDM27 TaxID=2854769 RepID=UPI00157138E8|nr:hypothetical protein [Pseudomonas sp. PDM27]MBV7570669.1 hypothetical protein [Pseudomonas sp. PDM27]
MSSEPKADPTEQPNRWQDLLAVLPQVEISGVVLSGLSVDGAVQQALKAGA